ncbi:MAG: DUF5785 family protein [Halobacteriales archaeon]
MPIVEPEDGRSYGMAEVANWVDEEDLPMSRDDLEEYSDRDLMLAHDEKVRFGDVLEHVDHGEFDELVDLWGALGEGFRQVDPRVRERYMQD